LLFRDNSWVELSAEQQQAVRRNGQDVCCVAGPGSGKTAVLVERFAWLVEQGLDPASILAITFTEKAATQIKARLVRRFSNSPEKRRAVEHAPVSTIHSFCLGLLREHAVEAMLDPGFTVMDEREAEALQSAAMEAVLDRLAAERHDEFVALAEAWPAQDMARELRSVYESLRMGGGAKAALRHMAEYDPEIELATAEQAAQEMLHGSPPPKSDAQRKRLARLRDWLTQRQRIAPLEWLGTFKMDIRSFKEGHPIYDGRDRLQMLVDAARRAVVGAMHRAERARAREALIEFEREYAARKRARAMLDFEDLLEQALALLESNVTVRRETQERYGAILMDELQDTNPVQWRILDQVRRPGRFFAVGDINQSIYGFRYAAPEQFSEYQRGVEEQGGAIDRLERNYRSRKAILDAVTAVTIAQPCAGVLKHQLIEGRELPASEGPFVEVQRVETRDGNEEALWIARRLRELHGTLMVGDPPRPARFSDMAILSRTNTPFDSYEEALGWFGIPCVLARGRNFYEEPEVLDLTNWLRVIENPADEVALFGLLRSPFFGVSDEQLMRERMQGGLAPRAAMQRIHAARKLREEIPADRILARILDETGYLASLSRRARANVEKFLRLLRDLDAMSPGGLAEQIRHIDDLRATGKEPSAPEVEAVDAVQVMSVHTAKGLEFPVVVLASMQRGTNGSTPDICWSPRNGLGMRWRVPGSAESVEDPVLNAWQSECGQRERAEEDRLLYVAMTRAEERLILSWTEVKNTRGVWPRQAATGLNVEWPAEVGVAVETEDARVVRLAGEPEWMEPPQLADSRGSAVEVDAGREPGQAAAAVAVTALSVFAACPRRHFLQTVLRWPQPEHNGGSGAMALGTETHEFLGGKRALVSPEAHALAQTFLDSPLGRRAARSARVHREEDFLVDVDGTLLRGQIDLRFEEPRGSVLVDYKTDQYLSAQRLAGYSLQLRLYALAVERLTGRAPAEAWLFALRNGGTHQVDLGRESLDEALGVLNEWRAAEVRGDYPMRETAECRWCPYVEGACPARRAVTGA